MSPVWKKGTLNRPIRTERNAFAITETGSSSKWRKEETTNQCLKSLVKLAGIKTKLRREHTMTQLRNDLDVFIVDLLLSNSEGH